MLNGYRHKKYLKTIPLEEKIAYIRLHKYIEDETYRYSNDKIDERYSAIYFMCSVAKEQDIEYCKHISKLTHFIINNHYDEYKTLFERRCEYVPKHYKTKFFLVMHLLYSLSNYKNIDTRCTSEDVHNLLDEFK